MTHWSIIGYDEHGDLDGEACRCDLNRNHTAGARVDHATLVNLIDDLIRDNNLTCDPLPGNDHCMCSTARALRLLTAEGLR